MPTRREWMVLTGLTGLAAAAKPVQTVVGPSAEPAPEGASVAQAGGRAAEQAAGEQAGADLAAQAVHAADAALPEGPAPWWAFAPLTEGSALAAGWSLASLSPVRSGRAELVLEHEEGLRAEVHLRRHQPSFHGGGAGVAQSYLFDFMLMNGSQGEERTRETLGRLLLGLAEHVRGNERSAPDGVLASFSSHTEVSMRTREA